MRLTRLRRPSVAIPVAIGALGLVAVATSEPDGPTEEVISLPGPRDEERTPPSRPTTTTTTSASGPITTVPAVVVTTVTTGPGRPGVTGVPAAVEVVPTDGSGPDGSIGPGTGTGDSPGSPGDAPAAPTTTTTVAPPTTDVAFEHTFPADYAGPVWIRVQATDLESREVRIQWGPYQRLITHRALWPVTYVFEKGEGTTVPTTVTVSDGAAVRVTFGHGQNPPLASVDVNEGWTTEPSADEPADP